MGVCFDYFKKRYLKHPPLWGENGGFLQPIIFEDRIDIRSFMGELNAF